MKQIIASIFFIVFIISLIAIFFTLNQVDQEEKRLSLDLQHRSTLLAEGLRVTIEPDFLNNSKEYLQNVLEKFADKERFSGLAVYDNKAEVIAISSTNPEATQTAQMIVANAMDGNKAMGEFIKQTDQKKYFFAIPLHNENSVVGALMIIQNAGYIDTRLTDIWRTNLIRLSTQLLLIAIALIVIIRWIIYKPIKNLVESIRLIRSGTNIDNPQASPSNPLLSPLVKEISLIGRSLHEARFAASEEARLRLEQLDSPWTAQRLKEFMKDILKDRSIFVVSNREPYIHTKNGGNISYFFPSSGVVTAIEPIMQAYGGVWIAHGSGNADKLVVDQEDKIKVPPDEPKYTLKRVWLSEEEEKGYYYGFANEGIWPLCHMAHTRPIFRKEDWGYYQMVNAKFSQVLLSEIKGFEKPIILIQDYHFMLAPAMIKKRRPDAVIGFFWHIPWPNAENFSICPFRKELLDGVLGADLIGFHTQLHCNNFIETIGKELESLIDLEQFAVTRGGHTTHIKPFPISIAFYNDVKPKTNNHPKEDVWKLLNKLDIKISKSKFIGLGVDRLDYTKGILERFKAIEFFLDRFPEYKGNLTFIQIAPTSRNKIKKYQDFERDVTLESERINAKFRIKNWRPIILLKKRRSQQELYQLYKLANFCMVTSLHDGMNLVAKEFVAARDDEKGVLILSQFAGASRELKEALIINPYNTEQVARAIEAALTMSVIEQARRMKKLRQVIRNYNVYRWSAEFIKTLVNLE